MSFAGTAARGATVQLPLGQLALVGIGFLAVSNPEKLFQSLATGARLLQVANNQAGTNGSTPQQPIVIHQAPAIVASSSKAGYLLQLVVGVGVCWGSYVVLVTVLPDAAKGMLPVNRSVFNKAVVKLGQAVINLKDTVLVQFQSIRRKQDELGEKQDATHTDVVEIKTDVKDMRGDLSVLQEALDLCRESLSESERRTSYIARGVQLLTRGVSTILPEHENLLQELYQYNTAGDEFINSPVPKQQQQKLQEAIRSIHAANGGNMSTPIHRLPTQGSSSSVGTPYSTPSNNSPPSSPPEIKPIDSDPENEVPTLDNSIDSIHSLLHGLGYTRTGMVQ